MASQDAISNPTSSTASSTSSSPSRELAVEVKYKISRTNLTTKPQVTGTLLAYSPSTAYQRFRMGFAMDDMSDVRNYSQRITLTIAPTTYWPYDDDVVALAPLEAPLAMLPGLEPHSFGMKTLQDPQLSVNESYADLHLKVTYDGQSEDVAVGFKFGAEGDTFDCGPANEYRWWSVRVTNGSTLSY